MRSREGLGPGAPHVAERMAKPVPGRLVLAGNCGAGSSKHVADAHAGRSCGSGVRAHLWGAPRFLLVSPGALVVLVDGHQATAGGNAGVGEQRPGPAGVLGGDHVGVAQHLHGARREIPQVADRRADQDEPPGTHRAPVGSPGRGPGGSLTR